MEAAWVVVPGELGPWVVQAYNPCMLGQAFYPEVLVRASVIRAPRVFGMAWKLIKVTP